MLFLTRPRPAPQPRREPPWWTVILPWGAVVRVQAFDRGNARAAVKRMLNLKGRARLPLGTKLQLEE